jgi:hypothetical protein
VDQIFYIRQILEKKWEYNGTVHQLFIDFKKAYESVNRETLCNILLQFGIPKKLVRLIKICLNETYSKIRVGKICLINFLFRMGRNKKILYCHCFEFCFRICRQESPRKLSRFGIEWGTSVTGLY